MSQCPCLFLYGPASVSPTLVRIIHEKSFKTKMEMRDQRRNGREYFRLSNLYF
uniref:Uncharacterized protein n=1 Tax=Anguilla anguilla TaxID=7936 RepID=A0A0E9WAH3_ANGAN